MYLPAPPGASFFNPLVLRIEDFFRTGKPPYPVERTLLTGGILDAALRAGSNTTGRRHPELATIDYAAPADSGFIRSPLTNPTPTGCERSKRGLRESGDRVGRHPTTRMMGGMVLGSENRSSIGLLS